MGDRAEEAAAGGTVKKENEKSVGRTAPFKLKTGGRILGAPRRAPPPDMPTSTGQGAKRAFVATLKRQEARWGTAQKRQRQEAW